MIFSGRGVGGAVIFLIYLYIGAAAFVREFQGSPLYDYSQS